MTIRIALCADLDLGVIDGSAVWLQSAALTLARRNHVTVIAKAPIRRDALTRPLVADPRVHLAIPTQALSPSRLVDAIAALDDRERFDVIIVRGLALCHLAAKRFGGRLWTYLTDVPQRASLLTAEVRETISAIARASRHVLCQTEELRAYLESYVPGVDGKAILLPPMIPDAPAHAPSDEPMLRLGYAGKLAPSWRTLEMVEATAALRAQRHAVELHIVGDKLFGPADWAARMQHAITTTPGVIWHRGRPRDEALAIVAKVDLALSVRGPELDDSLELSTKLLEYGAIGLPVLLNRTPMHEDLLGADYPLFADPADLPAAILGATDELRHAAARRTSTASRAFTFEAIAARLQPWIAGAAANAPVVVDLARPKLASASRRVGLLDPRALDHALGLLPAGHRLHVLGAPPADRAWYARANAADVSVDGPAPLGAWLRKIGAVVVSDPESAALAAASGARTVE